MSVRPLVQRNLVALALVAAAPASIVAALLAAMLANGQDGVEALAFAALVFGTLFGLLGALSLLAGGAGWLFLRFVPVASPALAAFFGAGLGTALLLLLLSPGPALLFGAIPGAIAALVGYYGIKR